MHPAPGVRPQLKDDTVWVQNPWRDPALLEWQRGGRFELKIYRIPTRGQRRIVLAYTQAVKPVGGVRHFTYPLPVDPGGATAVRHFAIDVEVRGQDFHFALRSVGYPLRETERDGVRALRYSAEDFTPKGDLGIEWALTDRQSEAHHGGRGHGSALRDVVLVLPEGLRAVAPERLDTILSGKEVSISARMDSDRVEGPLILRGTLGEGSFERRYDVRVAASDNPGNAFLPRLYAAARIADLEQSGGLDAKKEALSLSTRFAVASRYSSLLVPDSEAMSSAFGLDALARRDRYTGQDPAEASEAKSESAADDTESSSPAPFSPAANAARSVAGPAPIDAPVERDDRFAIPLASDDLFPALAD